MKDILLFLCVILFISCTTDKVHRVSRDTVLMDTYLSVTIYDPDIAKERANALIDSTIIEMQRIEKLMTDYSDTSEVGIVNLQAGSTWVHVSDELLQLLRASRSYSEVSGGAFDVTVGPIVKSWDFLASEPKVPSANEITSLCQLVNYKNVLIDEKNVLLRKKGMRIDLGGIAKGYAVDRALEILKRNGVKNTIVDLGGNLGVWWQGTHALDSSVAEILIRHPRKEGKFFGSFKAGTCGISTSGDYQRFFFRDGVRYHHIINPATGFPVSGVVSVTIIADNAMNADALSTLVFVLGREKGMEFIKNSTGVEGLIVWEEGDTLKDDLSPGLVGKFSRFND